MELKSRLENLTDKGKWAALGASLRDQGQGHQGGVVPARARRGRWARRHDSERVGPDGGRRESKGSVDDVTDPRGGADT